MVVKFFSNSPWHRYGDFWEIGCFLRGIDVRVSSKFVLWGSGGGDLGHLEVTVTVCLTAGSDPVAVSYRTRSSVKSTGSRSKGSGKRAKSSPGRRQLGGEPSITSALTEPPTFRQLRSTVAVGPVGLWSETKDVTMAVRGNNHPSSFILAKRCESWLSTR